MTTEHEIEQTPPVQKRRRGPLAGTELAKRGGRAVREKYGQAFYSAIGKMGGEAVSERRGADFYRSIGRKGGDTTKARLGREHYERIGSMGGKKASKGRRGPRTWVDEE